MALISEFRFQIQTCRATNSSWIRLSDFNVAFIDLDFDCRLASAIDYLIDFHRRCRGIRGQRDVIEIIGNLPMPSAREEMKGCFGGQKDPRVSLSDVYMCREFSLFPPIVPEIQRAAFHCKIQVRETVPDENSAIA